jgi:hypothetical protein
MSQGPGEGLAANGSEGAGTRLAPPLGYASTKQGKETGFRTAGHCRGEEPNIPREARGARRLRSNGLTMAIVVRYAVTAGALG